MKKFSVFAVLGLLMPVCAPAANNNIKMVTYFPIPYVSYNELGVTKTCDLGLMDGCVLDSASPLLVHKTASDGALRLKEGMLSLSGPGVTGNRFVAGTDVISNSSIEFKHSLDVKSMTQSVQSLEATNRAYLGELNLFGETFPKCENNNSREMTWKRLTINDKEGVFLVCGGAEKAQETCTTPAQSENCCVKAGNAWVNGTCMHACSGYEVAEEEYMTCSGPGCAKGDRYPGSFTPTIGSCWAGGFWSMDPGKALLSEVKNGVCDTDEEWYYSDAGRLGWEGMRKFLRVTCEDQWPSADLTEEKPERSCAFYSTSDRQGDNWGSGPICLVGTLSCKYEKSEWQCPVGRSCGTEASSCL